MKADAPSGEVLAGKIQLARGLWLQAVGEQHPCPLDTAVDGLGRPVDGLGSAVDGTGSD